MSKTLNFISICARFRCDDKTTLLECLSIFLLYTKWWISTKRRKKKKSYMLWYLHIKKHFSSTELKAKVSISDQLGTKHKGNSNLFNWRAPPFSKGDNNEIANVHERNLKTSLLLQNQWSNFNQTWHKACLGEGDSSLFKYRAPPYSRGN